MCPLPLPYPLHTQAEQMINKREDHSALAFGELSVSAKTDTGAVLGRACSEPGGGSKDREASCQMAVSQRR